MTSITFWFNAYSMKKKFFLFYLVERFSRLADDFVFNYIVPAVVKGGRAEVSDRFM